MRGRKQEAASSHEPFQFRLSQLIFCFYSFSSLDGQVSEHFFLTSSAHIKGFWKFLHFLCFYYRMLCFTHRYLVYCRLISRKSKSINRPQHLLLHAFLFFATSISQSYEQGKPRVADYGAHETFTPVLHKTIWMAHISSEST